MKLLIREDCSYRSESFKKGTIVEVGEATAKVLLHFNYAKGSEDSETTLSDAKKAETTVPDVTKKAAQKATQKSKQASADKVSDG